MHFFSCWPVKMGQHDLEVWNGNDGNDDMYLRRLEFCFIKSSYSVFSLFLNVNCFWSVPLRRLCVPSPSLHFPYPCISHSGYAPTLMRTKLSKDFSANHPLPSLYAVTASLLRRWATGLVASLNPRRKICVVCNSDYRFISRPAVCSEAWSKDIHKLFLSYHVRCYDVRDKPGVLLLWLMYWFRLTECLFLADYVVR
jgi:hypothetical protein